MPSNSYKISRVITELQARLEDQGDVDCVLISQGEPIAINADNMVTAIDLPGGRLDTPVLAFGITVREGVRTNIPGARYVSDDSDPEGWRHDLEAAPVGEDLDVWRRFKKDDRGQRQQDGSWWVYNDGAQLIECAKQGILGWRPRES